ncbi:signal peptidase I [Bacillus pseudomycoides]|uniref:Signal peptidase I n=1 Tax=Bacillus pseudomycoides TaxID=64104 RepID=A0AA91VG88_9BACI|nr:MULTISPECIES: DUF2812 domain-containing protein [Bacillus]PEB50851.1 signal peptidase I [Bacillus sp. AFS098217]PED84501.1 signal peptidase I [Bacillus pseudomycoides]PEU14293.1 signal peptidase I [Bacillus sp. AFS019443]PEU19823.1 signal peptidase I [Bacillus sp. AFS014408]PFW57669.1 signal peptidase I [Bacillus sp. AFS075034]
MEIKKTFKLFTAWNLEKEEAYLRKMHREGWALQNYNLMYTFKKTEPKDVVYKADFKLDYRNSLVNQKEYLEIYEMSGWKYVTSFTKWHYFCKEVIDDNELPDIYSEKETKIERFKDLLKVLVLFFAIYLLGMYPSFLEPSEVTVPIWAKSMMGFIGCMYVYIFVRLFWKIKKLKKEIL